MSTIWKNPVFWKEVLEIIIEIAREVRDRMDVRTKSGKRRNKK